MKSILDNAFSDLSALQSSVTAMAPDLERLGQAMLDCWKNGRKILTVGNGGSAADAMHLAEELVARFLKNRKGLAAIALCDPTVITCAANDFGFEQIFSRQLEAIGNAGDLLVVFTTSGNSKNILAAIDAAKNKGLITAGFLGKDGGQCRGRCDFQFIASSQLPHRIQEVHQILYHALCEWIDARVD